MVDQSSFDIIIVGAGSAGCVLANRLSEDPACRVLLIEGGGAARHPLIALPTGWMPLIQSGRFDWGIRNEPEAATDDRVWPQPRGKVIGGTSSINGMMYTRGNAADYNGWAARGLAGWGFADVLPYFRRAERNWRGATVFHGASGPLRVSRHRAPPHLYAGFVRAAASMGITENDDFNGAAVGGIGLPDFTMRRSRRESSATAYLTSARRRSNLTVLTKTLVCRAILLGDRAIGVEVVRSGRRETLFANREVVLSAGAYQSPQLLMLSGIGPAEVLRRHDIAVVADMPSVGGNLQDHPMVHLAFAAAAPVTFEHVLRADRLAAGLAAWAVAGRGPLAHQPMTAQLFVDLARNGRAWPDTQVQISHVSMMGRPWFPGWRAGAGHQFSVGALHLQPEGRGRIGLTSSDPLAAPRVTLGLLQTEVDRRAARAMVRFVRDLMQSAGAADLHAGEVMPGAEVASDADIDAFVRRTIMTGAHPVGTCAMGSQADGVVDAELRVHGIAGLRIVDASVMPAIPHGNTNAPTIMIAEKAADLIRGVPPLAPIDATQSPF